MSDTTTVRIPKETQEALKLLAAKNHRTVNGEASFALGKYVEENAHILEAAKQQAGA